MGFREDFCWGAATASYQIEGAHDADGKGPSVWDHLCRWPGKVLDGHTGDVACDHYHRIDEDVALMKTMGLKGYRFSISWPRVMPEGTGVVNEKGLAFYDRLVDALLDHGIQPWATLFHWDYPLALYHRGGWLNPRSPEWFRDYTRVIVDRLSDRVRHWMTLNEPQCFIGLGHENGTHAPGVKLPWLDVLTAGHHALMAHGHAVAVIREHAKAEPTIGWAPVGVVWYPKDNDPKNLDAARSAMFDTREKTYWSNSLFSDPAVLGHYPEDVLKVFAGDMPRVTGEDLKIIKQPLDFYGANIYSGYPVEDANTEERPAGFAETKIGWPVDENCLYWGPKLLQERYKLPIVITENGMSGHDWVDTDGRVNDPQRIDLTRRYLGRLLDAVNDGVDIRGYFHWSLMDNFEWAEGYHQRFGMIHIDYKTLKRTPKASAHWYKAIIASNGATLNEPVTLKA